MLCPICGTKDAYIGFTTVECINKACPQYKKSTNNKIYITSLEELASRYSEFEDREDRNVVRIFLSEKERAIAENSPSFVKNNMYNVFGSYIGELWGALVYIDEDKAGLVLGE